jgi:hypothetical protein
VFAFGSEPNFARDPEAAYAGVYWYPIGSSGPAAMQATQERPLNPYLEATPVMNRRMPVLECPLDEGVFIYSDRSVSDIDPTDSSQSAAPNTSSYRLNAWQYCKPGRDGWSQPFSANNRVNFRSNLGPRHVQIPPSRFVIFGDFGPFNWSITAIAQRGPLGGGWWHGPERAVFSFLDGSARTERPGRIVSPTYSLYMVNVPFPNSPGDFRHPGRP